MMISRHRLQRVIHWRHLSERHLIGFRGQTALDKAFAVGIGLKAIDAISELVGGLWLLFVSPQQLQAWAGILFTPELREDPNDFVATHVVHWAAHFKQDAVVFAAIYLLSHGIAKAIVVAEILRGRLWAYPGLIVLTAAFAAYQIYHVWTSGPSFGFVALTIFDLVIIVLTTAEYVKLRIRRSYMGIPKPVPLN
ncbi:MAG: DUF2127 domain-containing protein [Rhodanobacteraceae bacterium]|nr:MAG: DUF2127 domain-containing protein [Rhodanobacteraceae bacterium]